MRRTGLTLCLLLVACEGHDLGKPCDELLGDTDPAQGTTRTDTRVAIGQNTCYPCSELICVATDGKPGYCSKKCRDDTGCPGGFTCRILQPLAGEEFAGSGFCVWSECVNDADCGNEAIFACKSVPHSDPAGDLQRCDYIDPEDVFGPIEEVVCTDETQP